jgi:plastocyanin
LQYLRYQVCFNQILSFRHCQPNVKGTDMKLLLVSMGFFLLFVMGCKSDSTTSYGQGSTSPPPNTVVLSGIRFNPATLTVKVGASVTWRNDDPYTHTSTSDTGVWDSGNIAPGGTASKSFTTAGTYHYHCLYHQSMGMVGTIVVQ